MHILLFLSILGCGFNGPSLHVKWGFHGHKKITYHAIFLMPPEVISLYKQHADYLVEQSVMPDRRRYVVEQEAPRHYVDLERYQLPVCDSLPQFWSDALAVYGEDSLNEHGILPWHILSLKTRLTSAFRERDRQEILRLSAELSHYLADLTVPLHTTENYDGQLSDQAGLHALWESRLPELFDDRYNYWLSPPGYLDAYRAYIFKELCHTHAKKDSVLQIEKHLRNSWPEDKIYGYAQRGAGVAANFSEEYARAYHENLHGMVAHQMRRAIWLVASTWYTCWLEAGEPHFFYNEAEILPLPPTLDQPKDTQDRQHRH